MYLVGCIVAHSGRKGGNRHTHTPSIVNPRCACTPMVNNDTYIYHEFGDNTLSQVPQAPQPLQAIQAIQGNTAFVEGDMAEVSLYNGICYLYETIITFFSISLIQEYKCMFI